MNRKQELKKAFQEFVQQTEKAQKEGWIYNKAFNKKIQEARSLFVRTKEDNTYSKSGRGFHVLQQ